MGIIGLILVSLTVCTFKRVIPARLPPLHPVKVDKMPLHASFEIAGDAAGVRERVATFFASRGWQVRERVFGGTEWTFADKHNWARRGVLVAHIGFVIVATGTTIYWARGFAGETAVLTGQTDRDSARRTLCCGSTIFSTRSQPIMTKSGIVYQPVDYVSRVTVTGKDGVPKAMTVRVNHPIDIDDTLYYQASYGFGMRLTYTHDGKPVEELSQRTLMEGDSMDIPGSQRSMLYERFAPTVDRQSGQPSADPRDQRPGRHHRRLDAGQPLGDALVPLHTWIDLGGGWRVTPDRYVLYSGFQYRYDPGIPLVGIGAFVLLAGLIISFYLLPARLYVRVDEHGSGARGSGWRPPPSKGYDVYENEFRALVVQLRAST